MNTTEITMRYSLLPITHYPVPNASKFLNKDEQAWNLAWLSFDFDKAVAHPDPKFSVNVYQTVQTMVRNGVMDVANTHPELTVREYLKQPAPKAVQLILAMTHLDKLPMYKAYGPEWVNTILQRSHLAQEEHDPALDAPVSSTKQALSLLKKFM